MRFFLGQQVDQIVYVSTLAGKKNAGIRTRNGFYPSSLVIIEAGARDDDSSGQLHAPDSLAIPLSCYTSTDSNSFVEYVPQASSSVILLSGNLVPSSKVSMVGPLVVDLLEATSGQQTALQAQKVSETSPQPLSRL